MYDGPCLNCTVDFAKSGKITSYNIMIMLPLIAHHNIIIHKITLHNYTEWQIHFDSTSSQSLAC